MTKVWLKRLVWIALFAGIAATSYWLVTHRQDVVDWWKLRSYQPPAEVVALADSTGMVGRGRDMFYVSSPEVNERDAFNANCTDNGEESLVLGCYRAQRIYVYNVTDVRLSGVKEVTAVHEMLHAVYERLGTAEREHVDGLLQAQLKITKDDRLNGLIDLYNKNEPGQLLNEMHSILGTEFANLSPELETYYKQYVSDRAKIVAFSQAYESVFTESKNRIATYDTKLDSLKKQINDNNAKLDQQKADLATKNAQLDTLRASNPSAYNQAVPGYNASVRSFNTLVAQTKSLVSQYNNLVQQRNGEVVVQNDLYHSLDSNYQPVKAN